MQHIDLDSAVSRQSWEWLFDLAPRLDIIVEVVDSHGAPVFPVGSTPEAAALRAALTAPDSSLQAAIADAPSQKPVFFSIATLQAVCSGLAAGGALVVARNLTGAEPLEESRQDLESIANWLFRNYLQARSNGATPDEAREIVAKQIRESDEWRSKH